MAPGAWSRATTAVSGYASVLLRLRWLVVALATLVMLAMVPGARFIGVTNDYRSFFDDDNPQLAALHALEATYTPSKVALIAIAPKSGSVFTRETLGAIEELTERAWRTPWSIRVDSLTNHPHSEAFGDDLRVAALVDDASSLDDSELARIEEVALSAPEIAGRLVSRDGRVGGLLVSFNPPENADAAVAEINAYLDALLDDARAQHPDHDYYVTGGVVLNRTFTEAARQELETLAPIAFVLVLVAAALLLRSIPGTVALVVVILFVVGTTLGFAGRVGTVFNPGSSGVPIVVMTISLAHCVHVVTGALAGMRRHGLGRNDAIAESLRGNAWPILLASATTAIAFLSLIAADSPPFRVLGILVAFGVLCAFVCSMTLLPALLSILPLRATPIREGELDLFDRFSAFVVRRRSVLLGSVGLGALVLVTGIPRLDLSDNWTTYFDERYQFRRDTDFVTRNLSGMETLEYSLTSGREGGITDPDYLRRVDAFAEWYRGQPEVTHVHAFSDTMKRLERNMHGDDPAFHRLPDDPELAAQYLLLYELSLPFGADLDNRIDVARSATRMIVVMRSLTSREQRALDARAQAWLRRNTPGLAGEASGMTTLFAHLSERNIEAMLRGTIVAMALISMILIGVFRDLRLGLVSLVPNFLPAAMSFGLWGFMIGRVGLAASVVAATTFGIIVDDTIHFLCRYRKARLEGQPAAAAVQYTFRSVGRALWTTTIILALGFLVFASSGFELSWALGLLVTITIVFAILTDFLLLPPLLMAIEGKRR